jgi:hypothetical protein
VVRIKVACKDVSKIPRDKLYEMNLKPFLVSIIVEGSEVQTGGTNGDGGDDDDDKGNGKGDGKNEDGLDKGKKDIDRTDKDSVKTPKTFNHQ